MINELGLQSKCVDAVREMGGFAMKVSNRFLIGVPDLLIQLPDYTTSYWEVKRTVGLFRPSDLTVKQKMWLRDFTKAGGFGGVIYFVDDKNDTLVGIKPASFFNLDDMKAKWRMPDNAYVSLPRGCKMAPFKKLLEEIHVERSFAERKREYGY